MFKETQSYEHQPTHEQIAERAREIYQQSGCVPGRDQQNWLRAEAELQAGRRLSAGKATTTNSKSVSGRASKGSSRLG